MKKLLIIPFILLVNLCFSQTDTLLKIHGVPYILTRTNLGVQGKYLIVVDSTTLSFDSSLVVTNVTKNTAGDSFYVWKGEVIAARLKDMIGTSADSLKHLFVDTTTNRDGYCLAFDSTGHKWYLTSCGGGGGGGSVTSVSSGNLSPLFTTSVATATTTPAISYAISNAAAWTNFGNNTSSSAAPTYFTNNYSDSLKISGDTLYRRVNGVFVPQFTAPGFDTAFIVITANNLGSTQVLNKGLYLRDSASSVVVAQNAPPITFEGTSGGGATRYQAQMVYTPPGVIYLASRYNTVWSKYITFNLGTSQLGAAASILVAGPAGTITLTPTSLSTNAGALALTGSTGITYSGNNSTNSTGYIYNHSFTGTQAEANGSTTKAIFASIAPTVAWVSNPGVGSSYEALRVNVTETALPTGARNYFARFGKMIGSNYISYADFDNLGNVGFGDSSNYYAAKVSIGSTTQGFLPPKMTSAQRDKIVNTLNGSITAGGTGYATFSIYNYPLTGGSGTGATANVTTSGSAVTGITIRNPGNGYLASDVLSISGGGGTGFQWTISSLGAPPAGLTIYCTDCTATDASMGVMQTINAAGTWKNNW